jgi:hypothetical protein
MHTGATFTQPILINSDVTGHERNLPFEAITRFVDSIGGDFKYIIRINQPQDRYTIIGSVLTRPPRKKTSNVYENVVGLLYEDKRPNLEQNTESNKPVRFKQDFVLYNSKAEEFKFIIGDKWFEKFPKLRDYSEHIWNWKRFGEEIAHGQHYYNKTKKNYDHHYYNESDLPSGIVSLTTNIIPLAPSSPDNTPASVPSSGRDSQLVQSPTPSFD